MLDCSCDSTVLDTIPLDCIKEFLKDGKWIFQKLDDANNKFVDGVNGIDLAASWDPLPDALDDTKVAITPVLEEVDIAEPGLLEDSENLDGAPIQVDSEPTVFSAVFRLPTPAQYAALKNIGCEKALTVYRVDNNGKFAAREVNSGEYAGFKISPGTFNLSEPFKSGNTRTDQLKLRVRFVLAVGYYELFRVISPASGFDPLNDIIPS